ncbi:hypothetical protein [Acetobacterium tundrae]|uniref:Uncharacterized protein n=1 Tax=Acetobacterium tundrae TaxID=132932 RepID=A0ABR6WIQ8_9FIRM|nr:hypothetical protein [Acetobacterium tundrae]MBC3796379.1 hypothetical protein [Acetobacterium tundrae]
MALQSLKKHIVCSIAVSTKTETLKSNAIVLITSIGIITGSLDDLKGIKKDLANSPLCSMVDGFINHYREINKIENKPLDGNDGVIVLKDVIITNNGLEAKFKELAVFYDQIIGITLGDLAN